MLVHTDYNYVLSPERYNCNPVSINRLAKYILLTSNIPIDTGRNVSAGVLEAGVGLR